MIWLYRSLYPLVLPVLLPGILLRMRRRGGYRHRFGDRFGLLPSRRGSHPAPCVWVQAVSVGEVLAIEPLLRELARERPDLEWWVSTTTSTGFALARERLADLARIGYFPLDWWPCSALAWSRLRPSLVLLAEGEVWPEHLQQARRRGVPCVLLNGRLSDRSFRRYQRAGRWASFSWSWLSAVLAVSDRDARRIRRLAGPEVPVQTTGNLKFDVDLPGPLRPPARRTARADLGLLAAGGEEPLVLLGSSTWPGEEELLVRVVRAFLADRPAQPLRLVLVPRHAERAADLRAELAGSGLPLSVRSEDGPCRAGAVVYLADTTGELRHFTALADLVFIGKSLPPHRGGQTPIEGAAAGRALVSGPDLSNFRTPSRGLEAAGGLRRAASAEEAEAILLTLLRDGDARATLGERSRAWYESNHGACERMAEALQAYLPAPAAARAKALPALQG